MTSLHLLVFILGMVLVGGSWIWLLTMHGDEWVAIACKRLKPLTNIAKRSAISFSNFIGLQKETTIAFLAFVSGVSLLAISVMFASVSQGFGALISVALITFIIIRKLRNREIQSIERGEKRTLSETNDREWYI